MNLIPPISITDALFHDSSITEPSIAELANPNYLGAYAAGTTYSVNAIVLVVATHKLYKSLKNLNVGNTPGGAGNETWWLDWGASERWKPFDGKVGSQATGADSITYELDPGPFDSIAILNLEAASVTVTVTDVGGAGPAIVWTETTLADGLFVTDIVKTDFPLTYLTPHVLIEITYTGYTALVGEIIVGQKQSIGTMKFTPSVGIIDYSVKQVDAFGNYTVLERAYSKRLTCETFFYNTSLDAVYNLLAEYRAQPAVWVGSEDYASLIVYGYYKRFSIALTYPTFSICTLEIEGLV